MLCAVYFTGLYPLFFDPLVERSSVDTFTGYVSVVFFPLLMFFCLFNFVVAAMIDTFSNVQNESTGRVEEMEKTIKAMHVRHPILSGSTGYRAALMCSTGHCACVRDRIFAAVPSRVLLRGYTRVDWQNHFVKKPMHTVSSPCNKPVSSTHTHTHHSIVTVTIHAHEPHPDINIGTAVTSLVWRFILAFPTSADTGSSCIAKHTNAPFGMRMVCSHCFKLFPVSAQVTDFFGCTFVSPHGPEHDTPKSWSPGAFRQPASAHRALVRWAVSRAKLTHAKSIDARSLTFRGRVVALLKSIARWLSAGIMEVRRRTSGNKFIFTQPRQLRSHLSPQALACRGRWLSRFFHMLQESTGVIRGVHSC